jgi:hypothetical protein
MQPHSDDENDVWRTVAAALARRQEAFTLSELTRMPDGYIVKFRLGILDVVRTAIAPAAFYDEARLNQLLDGARRDFRAFDPTMRGGRP